MDKTKKIITNFIKNKYSRNEYFSVLREFEKNDSEGEFLRELETQWNEIDENETVDFQKKRVWENILKKTKITSQSRTVLIWQYLQRSAAILFLPLLLASLFYYYSENWNNGQGATAEVLCPMGVRTKFELPDGTTGFLNSGSTLKYPIDFSKSRKVSVQGEAYFDVIHDKKHPFVVQTCNLDIKVLGTKFNVSAYEKDFSEQVVLNQGSVEVLGKNGNPLSILKPDQRFILDSREMKYHTDNVQSVNFTSWTEGKLMFRNENIQEVMTRIGRWYNVEFELEDDELLQYSFRATFVDEPLEEVFKLLTISAPIQFEEQVREGIANGEYGKRRINIKLDYERLDAFKK